MLSCIESIKSIHTQSNELILVGHSAGAHIASHIALSEIGPRIKCVVGIEGIYDIPKLFETHGHIDLYNDFIKMAFTDNRELWKIASPVNCSYLNCKVQFLIIHSKNDELVETGQSIEFHKKLESSNVSSNLVVEEFGKHDEMLKNQELFQVIKNFILKC